MLEVELVGIGRRRYSVSTTKNIAADFFADVCCNAQCCALPEPDGPVSPISKGKEPGVFPCVMGGETGASIGAALSNSDVQGFTPPCGRACGDRAPGIRTSYAANVASA